MGRDERIPRCFILERLSGFYMRPSSKLRNVNLWLTKLVQNSNVTLGSVTGFHWEFREWDVPHAG